MDNHTTPDLRHKVGQVIKMHQTGKRTALASKLAVPLARSPMQQVVGQGAPRCHRRHPQTNHHHRCQPQAVVNHMVLVARCSRRGFLLTSHRLLTALCKTSVHVSQSLTQSAAQTDPASKIATRLSKMVLLNFVPSVRSMLTSGALVSYNMYALLIISVRPLVP